MIEFVFKFAQDLVNAGLYFDQGDQDRQEFMTGNVRLVGDALAHASTAIRVLAAYYILPAFGYGG